MKWWKKGGWYAGNGRSGEVAGIVHRGSVALPRAVFDKWGEEAIRNVCGQDTEITIIEQGEGGAA